MLVNPFYVSSFGFWMSYLCCFGIYVITRYKFQNNFILAIAINLVCTLVSLPFCLKMDDSFDLMSVIYGIILTYPFLLEFIFSLLTFWITPIHVIQDFTINCFVLFVTCIDILNATIAMNMSIWVETIYWFFCFLIMYYANIFINKYN
jgi:hypothetical protein